MKILDIALKDLLRSFRSPFAVGMMFVAPMLITGLISFAFGGMGRGAGRFDLPPLDLVIVNRDPVAESGLNLGRLLVDYFHDERMPDWLHVTELADEAQARAAVDRGEAGVAILIPPDFSAAVMSAEGTTALTLVQDPTLSFGPGIVKDLVTVFMDGLSGAKIAMTVAGTQAAARGGALDDAARIAITERYTGWFAALQQDLRHGDDPVLRPRAPSADAAEAPSADPIAQIMARVMAGMMIFFTFFTGANTAQTILREDEEGTLARLFTTPTPRSAILGGKFASVFVTVGVQAVVLMTASALAFRIRWGQPLAVVLTTLAMVIAAAGFGVFVLSFVKTTRQAGPVVGGVLSAVGMLGGLFTTGVPMPAAFDTLTLVTPHGWALRGWKLALAGGGPADVLLPALVMFAMGGAFFALGVLNFRKRFA